MQRIPEKIDRMADDYEAPMWWKISVFKLFFTHWTGPDTVDIVLNRKLTSTDDGRPVDEFTILRFVKSTRMWQMISRCHNLTSRQFALLLMRHVCKQGDDTDMDLLEQTLSKDSDLVDKWDHNGRTMLTCAVWYGNITAMDILFRYSANVEGHAPADANIASIPDWCSKRVSLFINHKDLRLPAPIIVKLEKHPNLDGPALLALKGPQYNELKLTLKESIGMRKLLNVLHNRPQPSFTPLMAAATTGQVRAAELLLQHKANPNAVTKNHATALMIAAHGGFFDMCAVLLREKALLLPSCWLLAPYRRGQEDARRLPRHVRRVRQVTLGAGVSTSSLNKKKTQQPSPHANCTGIKTFRMCDKTPNANCTGIKTFRKCYKTPHSNCTGIKTFRKCDTRRCPVHESERER